MGNYIPLWSRVIFYWLIEVWEVLLPNLGYCFFGHLLYLLRSELLRFREMVPHYHDHVLNNLLLILDVDVVEPSIEPTTTA
ncbi:hypothetical protein D3C85_1697240 [compost metagenome]